MRYDLIRLGSLHSSFFSCEKDVEKILTTLFVDSKPYSDRLKRLLLLNTPDCLDEKNTTYKKFIDSYSLGRLREEGYVRLNPKIKRGDNDNIRSYILIGFDNFSRGANPEYLDCTITFDVVCYTDEWCLDDYKIRPILICGYIDGILNDLSSRNKNSKNGGIRLSGIGEYQILGCSESLLNEDLGMYSLSYRGTHFSEDKEVLTSDE